MAVQVHPASAEAPKGAFPARGAAKVGPGLKKIDDDEIKVLSRKEKLWLFLDDPGSGKGAQMFSLATMGLISFSVFIFCLESLPRFYQSSLSPGTSVWDVIETCCVFIFTLEYLLRLASCPSKRAFMFNLLNLVDLVAIVPFYMEQFMEAMSGGDTAVFRVVRLVRVFRIFKISRYISWISIFVEAMIHSAQPLIMLLFVMMIACVFFSSAMFFLERGDFDEDAGAYMRGDGTVSPFQSIPGTFYFCIVSMATVGYGDIVPITPAGKLVASITSLVGILSLAVPITVVSTNFSVEYDKLKMKRKTMRARVQLLKSHFKERRTGLDAMNAEVDDLVKRASLDLLDQVRDLIEVSREETTFELRALVQLAYASRQHDLGVVKKQHDADADIDAKRRPAGLPLS